MCSRNIAVIQFISFSQSLLCSFAPPRLMYIAKSLVCPGLDNLVLYTFILEIVTCEKQRQMVYRNLNRGT